MELNKNKPYSVVIRVDASASANGGPAWELFAQGNSMAECREIVNKKVAGRGITAWSWHGPTGIAEEMLANPGYNPEA